MQPACLVQKIPKDYHYIGLVEGDLKRNFHNWRYNGRQSGFFADFPTWLTNW